LTPLLLDNQGTKRELLFYYRAYQLMAVRQGPWKAHLMTQDGYGPGSKQAVKHDPPLLFNLEHDPSERENVAAKHPEVVAQILRAVEKHRASLEPAETQLEH
jgi:arylsulfatase A-like enzyme